MAARARRASSAARDDLQRVLAVVDSIPRGRVASYGDVARLALLGRRARWVGRVLRELPKGTKLPWHRVVNAAGRISQRGAGMREQRWRLEREGVVFVRGRLDRKRFGWRGDVD